MQIVRAREEYLSELNEIIASSKRYWNYSEAYLSKAIPLLMLSSEYLKENLCFQVVNADNEIAGFFSVIDDRANHFLDHLWIKPGSMRKGYGRLAIDFVRALAAKKGWDNLLVLPDPEAVPFYKKCGFVETGLRRPSRVDGGPEFEILRMNISDTNLSIYSPQFFREDNFNLILKVIKENSFATLLASNSSGAVSHLPFLVRLVGDQEVEFVSHMARANPQWEEIALAGKAKIIFGGPHSYISPAWYLPKLSNVPTWNYVAIHAFGDFKIVSERDEASKLMNDLIEEFEGIYGTNWTLPSDQNATQAMMDQIVIFKIENVKIESKFKLSQQQDSTNRESVIEQLKKHGNENLSVLMEMTRKTK
ncbi:MAG: GNAT family N-acetyltransferase [Bdellovibrionales bacterium]|nr:GNAT family N-acetyltransferase [Bdellovibrionales bacterium]